MKTIQFLPYLFTIVAFALGVWFGYVWEEKGKKIAFKSPEEQRIPWQSTKLTSPLLECKEAAEELSIGDRVVIEKSIATYIDKASREGVLDEVAVYFRDLNNGPWFGINERQKFIPGSLLKLPLALSVYWIARSDPASLTQSIEYQGTDVSLAEEKEYGSDQTLVPGIYSLRDLVRIMLQDSNNEAAEVLAQILGQERVLYIYNDLGILSPQFGSDYEIDVKTFGAFFRVLFNASYVGEAYSEEILTILTQSKFTKGIVAGVPQSVRVAHKFGIRSYEGETTKQLHDCGIVYIESPYVLCIMTKGKDTTQLEGVIRDISTLVYEGAIKSKP